MKHNEISKESTTQFTAPLRTVGNLIVSNLATEFLFIKISLECYIKSGTSRSLMIYDPQVQFETLVQQFNSEKQHASALVQKVTPNDIQLREPASENNATNKKMLIFRST
jgi:hypothetical protein